MCAVPYAHRNCYSEGIREYKLTSPDAGCYWFKVFIVAMAMVMLDYTCAQIFMIAHCTNDNF